MTRRISATYRLSAPILHEKIAFRKWRWFRKSHPKASYHLPGPFLPIGDQGPNCAPRALEFEESGRFDLALQVYFAGCMPDDAGALANVGILFYRMKQFDLARRYCEAAIAARPGYALAHFNLAIVLEEQRDYDAAEAQYLCAIAINPQWADPWFNLGRLLHFQKKQGEAKHALERYLSLEVAEPWRSLALHMLEGQAC